VLPYLSSIKSMSSTSPQFKHWSEWLLSRLCLLTDQSSPASVAIESELALQVFRVWSRLFEIRPTAQGIASASGSSVQTASARRRVWKAYYDTLSMILQKDLKYIPNPTTPHGHISEHTEKYLEEQVPSTRLQQRAELKRVETLYEAQLLQETQFPKSNQATTEIELWVDSVIANWRVLCGPSWIDEDLGEGGKAAVGREVLDVRLITNAVRFALTISDSVSCSNQDLPLHSNSSLFVHSSCFFSGIRSCFQSI
jgi:cargo-transport protein YPP1